MSEQRREATRNLLHEISTRWQLIDDPVKFVLRYAPAVRAYLGAILKNSHDVDDVAQDFVVKILQNPITPEQVRRGRFRDYLKAVVRNTALAHLRRKKAGVQGEDVLRGLAARDEVELIERGWVEEWRRCLLDRAWGNLEEHQRQSPGSLCYPVLRLSLEHAQEDSPTLAERASRLARRTVKAEAFRKQLSRARRLFAELVVREVEVTLETPTAEEVKEELADLGLLSLVGPYLRREGPEAGVASVSG